MKFISFGSGSSGNCYYIESDNKALIIDQGIGLRKLKSYYNQYGINESIILGLLVTHDHTDHIRGVGVTAEKYKLPVYTSEKVHQGMDSNRFMQKKINPHNKFNINFNTKIEIGPFIIEAFEVPHDASQNIGYFISTKENNICIMTDCGNFTTDMQKYIGKSKNLIIESNYDEDMLEVGPYPIRLKNRIKNGYGHSSNKMTGIILQCSISDSLRQIWLCHLSEENNTPEICKKTIEEAIGSSYPSVKIHVLPRKSPMCFYNI